MKQLRHAARQPQIALLGLLVLSLALWPRLAGATDVPNPTIKPEKSELSKRGISEGQSFGIAIENDSKNIGGPGSDQAYSNGVHFAYVYARNKVPKWAPKSFRESEFFKGELTDSTANFGISINHQIFTPENILAVGLQTNDRPYVAWLNASFSVVLKNQKRSQSIELSLGTIGPAANGESVQNSFHRWIGTEKAEGWGNQLKDEPTVQINYQQRLSFLESRSRSGAYFDLIPMFGGGLGNVIIGLHSGLLARIGYNLPDDVGPSRPSGGDTESFVAPMTTFESRSSYYFFAGIRGNAVARNIFLDGNTFQESHRVTKFPFNFETEVGLSAQVRPVNVTWRFVVRSPEFEQDKGFHSFASVGLSISTD
ncbi:MAG: lipid A deacylase LpxR family protein [Deltaproteobacteria bacterium]|nr:lipid A deacylase LpxR family protein [Deltaproteobacteria bacterium]